MPLKHGTLWCKILFTCLGWSLNPKPVKYVTLSITNLVTKGSDGLTLEAFSPKRPKPPTLAISFDLSASPQASPNTQAGDEVRNLETSPFLLRGLGLVQTDQVLLLGDWSSHLSLSQSAHGSLYKVVQG